MEVVKKVVYRIVNYDVEVKEEEPALPSKWKIVGVFKKLQEDSLEKFRPKRYPQRDKCLYVCFSKENAYEWASIKYGKQNTYYKLLTLEVSGDLFWLKADCYNSLRKGCSQEEVDKASVSYWNSSVEEEVMLTLDKGFEGLFVGENKIIAIEYKNYINGESIDVE